MKSIKLLLNLKVISLFMFIGILFSLTSCDVVDPEEEITVPDSLYVQFNSDSSSVVTITSIMVLAMGEAPDSNPTGDWSGDILADNQKIEAGQNTYFKLEIPNLHWVRYRLGVDDGSGIEIFLQDQPNYDGGDLPITHWGSDDRTVSVTIKKNPNNGEYYIGSWSDFAGID
ncbi:MAG: hypothetical protein PF445_05560 [Melioribacteraceae bacterium]|jgi:hypothetical protein|nr:hypothetical protein [Melioribacteraceae bacterium]